MVVVDTCVFIDFLKGNDSVPLKSLTLSGLVLISGTVYLELLQGVRKSEEKYLEKFMSSIGKPLTWPRQETCLNILKASRGSGVRFGLPDIMILADAIDNGAKLMTIDSQLIRLAKRVKVGVLDTV
jgi:predicted nucleic acid-binding protein